MDEIDQAQGYNEDFQAYALSQQQKQREPGNYSGTDCLECGAEIPLPRRQAVPGCRRCVECQKYHEKRGEL